MTSRRTRRASRHPGQTGARVGYGVARWGKAIPQSSSTTARSTRCTARETGTSWWHSKPPRARLFGRYSYDAPFIVAGRDAEIVKEYHLENGTGPASTPLIVGDALFAVGPTGIFHSLNKKTGKVVWQHKFITDLQGYVRQRGYAVSPLAYKNTVILPVGAVGASVIAFNQKDGSIVWKKNDFRHAYASPFIIDVDGQEQLVLFMETEIIGIDPNNGDLLWMHPANPQGTNVSTPVWGDGNLSSRAPVMGMAATASNSPGLEARRASKRCGRTIESGCISANAMRIGDVIYGSSGDFGPAFFTALKRRRARSSAGPPAIAGKFLVAYGPVHHDG